MQICGSIKLSGWNNIDNNIIIQNVNDDNILFEHCYNDSISYKTLGNRILSIIIKGDINSSYIKMEDILYGLIGDIYWRKDIGCVDIDYDNILIHKNENLNKILDTCDNNNIGVLNNINIFKLSDYGLNYSLVSILNSISDKSDLVIKIFGSDGYILLAHDLVNNSINKMLINRTKPLYITSYYRGITKDNNNIFKYIEGIKDVCKYNNINILNCEEMALDIEKPDLLVNIVGIVNTINGI